MAAIYKKALGLVVGYEKCHDPKEPLWSNTVDGHRHQRLFSIERVIAPNGAVGYNLLLGRYKLSWAKQNQRLL